MARKLVVVAGPDAGRTIPLDDMATLTVGRGEVSDAQLNDRCISRVHCTLEVLPQGVTIMDAGSKGGTFVGGQKTVKCQLSHGDKVQIGASVLRFESDQSAGSPFGASSTNRATAHLSEKELKDLEELNSLAGQMLGCFKLECIDHVGRLSVLFRGQDQQHDRPVMVKVMFPSVTSNEVNRRRFVRAVHSMMNVRHHNLVEIYGAGKQHAYCWCAMEFIDGISILDVIGSVGTQRRLDWREIYRVALHVARALECAYQQKVIHRNITPDNLIQRKSDRVVKLCDLMLAKALEGAHSELITDPGQMIGDVAYMSPERMMDTSNLDWRSDQYGLGATLFALLTGHPPIEGDSLGELVTAVHSHVPTFSGEVQREANAEFLQMVLRMLAKVPGDRYSVPSQLTGFLENLGVQTDFDADVLYNT